MKSKIFEDMTIEEQIEHLRLENADLKERIKYLEDLIKEYTGKIISG